MHARMHTHTPHVRALQSDTCSVHSKVQGNLAITSFCVTITEQCNDMVNSEEMIGTTL